MATAHKSIVFLALTFALSWGAVAIGWAFGATTNPTLAFATMVAMMFGPSVAALICALTFERNRRREALGLFLKPNWWWLYAWLIALLTTFGASLVTVVAGQASFVDIGANYVVQARAATSEHSAALDQASRLPALSWIIVAQAALLGGLLNTIALTLSEELGWRGYLYDLWRRFGFLKYTLATGAIWGLWHAPAIWLFGVNYPSDRLIGIPLFVVFCILYSFPFTLVRDRGKSVIAAAILHGTGNAIAGVAMLGLSQATFPWNGIVGIGGFVTLALIASGSWAISLRLPAFPSVPRQS